MQSQTNRALFVGISDYPVQNGWTEIHGADDYKLVLPMLKRSGYKMRNIRALLDEKATKAAIVEELKNLEKKSSEGDRIYIHFSCHGQQMADDNADESDGLDEAIIPYDAQYRFSVGKYEGENHLRDDELEVLLDKIRAKAGVSGNVIVVLDACHSGTGTRYGEEDEYIRGTTYVFAPEDYIPLEKGDKQFSLRLKKAADLSPISVFSACLDEETNNEYRTTDGIFYGSLSYVFCKSAAIYSGNISNVDYSKKLKEELQMLMSRRKKKQTPYFESTNEKNIFQIGKK